MIEKDLIYYYKSNRRSYNITDGGEGFVGVILSEETRKKIADSNRGKHHDGHPCSEETRKKIADRLKGNTNGSGHHMSEKNKLIMRDKCKKPLYQFDLDGNLIKIWECQHDAAMFFGCTNASNLLAVARGDQYSAYGYRWSRTENLPNFAFNTGKPIYQLDLDGNIIARFDSMAQACLETSGSRSGISNVCRGKLQTSGGYK